MRNDAGHEIRIAHKNLHPATRGQLAALPMASGGNVPEPSKKGSQQMQTGATSGGTSASDAWKNLKSGLGFANGGNVKDPTQQHLLPGDDLGQKAEKQAVGNIKSRMPVKMAKGGMGGAQDTDVSGKPYVRAGQENQHRSYPEGPQQEPSERMKELDLIDSAPNLGSMIMHEKATGYADGGDVNDIMAEAHNAANAVRGNVPLQEYPQAPATTAAAMNFGMNSMGAPEAAAGKVLGAVEGAAPKALTQRELAMQTQRKGIEGYKADVAKANAQSATNKRQGFAEGTPDGPIQPDETEIQPPSAFSMAKGEDPNGPQPATEPSWLQKQMTPGGALPPQQAAPSPQAPPQPQQAPQATAPQPAVGQANQQAPAASTQGDPYGNNAYQDAYMKGLNSQMGGLQKEASAAEAQGKAQAELLGKQQGIQAQQATEYQTHYKALDAERQALIKDIQDQHIDPNHFVNTMDGGSRIATAIGLIASGMGGGMSHQGNLAAEFLHKQIDNDIKAQQANLGQKENLLSANMRQFGNMRDAMDMTRVMQTDILANQMKAEAMKQVGPMAQANLLKAAGQLEMQAAPVLSQIAMRKTLMSGMAKGQVAPESVIRMVVPKEEQAGATKELMSAQNAYKAKDNILSAFDRIAQINTVGNRVGSPIQTPRQVAALRDPIIAGLSKETAGRFTEQDAHMLGALFPAAGDSAETLNAKRTQTVKLITEKLNYPELKKWGIDLSNTGRYDNTGKPRIPEGKPVR